MHLDRLPRVALDLHPTAGTGGRRLVLHRSCVGRIDADGGGQPGLVVHFNKERSPALLDELRLGLPLLHLYSCFRVDLQTHQTVAIQNRLDPRHRGGRQLSTLGGGQRFAR